MKHPPDAGASALIRQKAAAETAQGPAHSGVATEHSLASPPIPPLPEIPHHPWIDRLPVLFFELAPDGKVLFVNPMVTSATGFRPEELLGHNWWSILCPGEWSRQAEEVRQAMEGADIAGMELMLLAKSGRPVFLEVTSSNIYGPGGLQRVIAFAIDVSRRHAAEDKIIHLRAVQEQQEIYLHTISHDLRTPLTILYGHAELLEDLLRRGGLDKEAQPSLEALHQGIERMSAMIGDLIDVARLEGGELAIAKEIVDLGEFTDRLLRQSRMAMDVGRIRNEIPPALPPVMADKDRLARILANLLSNALKYSAPEAPVWIRASDAGDEIVVSILDRGEGIAGSDLPRIFERFHRLQRERQVDGLGLGLYITKMLVEAHGGRIWVESREGEGSTFFFSLPKAGLCQRQAPSAKIQE